MGISFEIKLLVLIATFHWSTSQECSSYDVHLLLPHESDCSKFYQCSHGNKVLHVCPDGLVFDEIIQVCNWPDLVNCDRYDHIPVTEPATNNNHTNDYNDKNSTATNEASSAPTIIDPSDTTTTKYEVQDDECPSYDVHLLLPHESDCSKFYQCSHGNKVLHICPDGLVFDKTIQVCNWPYAVSCSQYDQNATGTTESAPTTSSDDVDNATQHDNNTSGDYVNDEGDNDFGDDDNQITKPEFETTENIDDVTFTTEASSSGQTDNNQNEYTHELESTTQSITESTVTDENTESVTESIATTQAYDDNDSSDNSDSTTQASTTLHQEITTIFDEQDGSGTEAITTGIETTESVSTVAENIDSTTQQQDTEATTHINVVSTTSNNYGETTTEFNYGSSAFTEDVISTTIESVTETSTHNEPTIPNIEVTTENSDFNDVSTTEYSTTTDSFLSTDDLTTSHETELELTTESSSTTESHESDITTSDKSETSTESQTTNVNDSSNESQSTTESSSSNETESTPSHEPESSTESQSTTESFSSTESDAITEIETTTLHEPETESSSQSDSSSELELTTISSTELESSTESQSTTSHETDSSTESHSESSTESSSSIETSTIHEAESESSTESQSTTESFSSTESDAITETETITSYEPESSTTTESSSSTESNSSTEPTLSPNGICPSGFFGNIPHPDRCDSFFMCTGGSNIQLYCISGQEYDAVSQTCVPITGNGCTQISTTTHVTDIQNDEPEYDDDESSGDFEDPDDNDLVNDQPIEEVEDSAEQVTVDIIDSSTIASTTEVDDSNEFITVTEGFGTSVVEDSTGEPDLESITQQTATTKNAISEGTNGQYSTTEQYYPTTISDESTTQHYKFTTGNDDLITEKDDSTTQNYDSNNELTTENYESITHELTTQPQTTEQEGSTTIVSPTTQGSICPAGFMGNIEHPEFCDSYYLCTAGFAIQLHCPSGMEFDVDSQQCTSISQGGCTLGSLDYEGTTIIYHDPETTTTDFETSTTPNIEHESTMEEVDDGTFSTTTVRLTTPSSMIESTAFTTITNEILPETTTEVHEYPDTEFDVEIPNDLVPETVVPQNPGDLPSEPVPESMCSPGYTSNQPHPDRCDSYYMCIGGSHIQLFCVAGQQYDPELQRCVLSEDACSSSG